MVNIEADDGKDGPQPLSEAEEWFIEQFGVPFSWACELASMDNDIGHKWKSVLEGLNDLVDNEPQE